MTIACGGGDEGCKIWKKEKMRWYREIESLVVQGGMVQKVEKNDDGAGKESLKRIHQNLNLISFVFLLISLVVWQPLQRRQQRSICVFASFCDLPERVWSSAAARTLGKWWEIEVDDATTRRWAQKSWQKHDELKSGEKFTFQIISSSLDFRLKLNGLPGLLAGWDERGRSLKSSRKREKQRKRSEFVSDYERKEHWFHARQHLKKLKSRVEIEFFSHLNVIPLSLQWWRQVPSWSD